MPYGVTSTGFARKTTENILAELAASQRASISTTLDTSSSSPVGQLNGIYASQLGEAWEALQATYDSYDPDNAVDAALTALGALTGTQRDPATRSRATVDLTFGAPAVGTHPPGTLIAHAEGNADHRFSNVEAVVVAVPGVITGVIFEAEDTGPIEVAQNKLNVIAEPVPGWTAVLNPAAATPGSNIESDPALRLRREAELGGAGSGTLRAVEAAVSQLDFIESVQSAENTTMVTDSNGLPAKSFEIIVRREGGTALTAGERDQVAQAIWDNKAGGILSYGSTSGTAEDAIGVDHVIGFSVVTERRALASIQVQRVPGGIYADADVIAAVKTAVRAIRFAIGDDIIVNRLRAAAMGVGGVLDLGNVFVSLHPTSPVASANIGIGPREIARFDVDAADVVVTVI